MPAYGERINFTKEKYGTIYPFNLNIPVEWGRQDDGEYPLTKAEAEELHDDLSILLGYKSPPISVVQVSIRTGPGRDGNGEVYSYVDPSGELVEGDLVRVPFGFRDEPTVGVVKKLGRGNYSGPLKSVLAKFQAVEL